MSEPHDHPAADSDERGSEGRLPPTGKGSGSGDELEELVKTELSPRFNVIRCLGSGPRASVFLAREPGLKRLIAIKVMAPELTRDERARMRFEREAQAAASLSHPNIVAVHTVERLSNGVPYIVMQYVKGRTVAERLEAEEAIPVDEGRRILSEVASALACAHSRGIVHRDVRPANVLLEEDTGRALLADFGIAAILESAERESSARLTRTGEQVGDPMWMSVEQLTGGTLTERSDVYALGLLGYALLAKRGPFDGSLRREQVRARLSDAPHRLSKLRKEVDRQLDDLLFRCLAQEPAHRPNASDVAERLASLPPEPEPVDPMRDLLSRLVERRVLQITVLYALVAWGVLQVVDQLADRKIVPELVYRLALVSALLGLPAVVVGAWFHGKKGDQPVSTAEYWLFGALALIWLTACVFVYLKLL